MQLHENNEVGVPVWKFIAIWLGTALSSLNNWVLLLTVVYTALQIYILIRDKIISRKILEIENADKSQADAGTP